MRQRPTQWPPRRDGNAPTHGPTHLPTHATGHATAHRRVRHVAGHMTGATQNRDGRTRRPGSALIATAAWLLSLIGVGALYVSYSAQRQYVLAARNDSTAASIEAVLLDLLMMVFTLLALGLSRAGKSSRTQRVLILVCAVASAYMNVSDADTSSPRSIVAYAVAPVALAVVVDQVVAVIRRHALGDDEESAWAALGSAVMVSGRLTALVMLYSLRAVLAPRETVPGLRRAVLAAAPLPAATPSHPKRKAVIASQSRTVAPSHRTVAASQSRPVAVTRPEADHPSQEIIALPERKGDAIRAAIAEIRAKNPDADLPRAVVAFLASHGRPGITTQYVNDIIRRDGLRVVASQTEGEEATG